MFFTNASFPAMRTAPSLMIDVNSRRIEAPTGTLRRCHPIGLSDDQLYWIRDVRCQVMAFWYSNWATLDNNGAPMRAIEASNEMVQEISLIPETASDSAVRFL